MRNLVLVCFIIALKFSFAQEETERKSLTKEAHKYNIAYKVPLNSWLDFVNPSLNFGVEKTFSSKFSLYQELGYVNDNLNPLYDYILPRNFNGVKVLIEPMLYLNHNRSSSLFLTPALLYVFTSEQLDDYEFSRFDGQYFQQFDYKEHKHIVSLTPKVGVNIIKPEKMVGFEFSAGIGVRVIHLASNDIPDDAFKNKNNNDTQWLFSSLRKDFGTYVRPNVSISIALLFLDKNNR